MRRFMRRLWHAIRQRRLDADLAEEIAFHHALKQRDFEERGLVPRAARSQAHRALGSMALARDRARDVWTWPWLQDMTQDLRFAARLLVKDRWFTLLAVAALALGIGVGNTFLIVVNAVGIRGLPLADVGRVMYLAARDASGRDLGMSYRDADDLRSAVRAFSGISAFTVVPVAIGDEGVAPDRALGAYISANAFSLIREEPALGRGFRPDDDRPGAPGVVIIGSGLWTSRYGGDRAVIGRTIRVNGVPSTVIGVMRQGLRFPNNADLWQPLALMPGVADQPRDARALAVFGRLRDGATMAQATTELTAAAERLSRDYPATNTGIHVTVVPINDRFNARLTDPVWLAFMTAGLLVLLIACANVANLLLMRATRRSREIAIRASLGATRRRVVRQLLVESLLLAALGGAVGLGFSLIGARLLSLSLTDNAPYWIHFTMDGRGFVVLAAVCLGTVFIFGLAPALHVAKTDVNEVLQEGGRGGTGGRRARRWTALFLTAEFALTVVLLAGVALGFLNFQTAQRAEVVINPHLLTMWVSLPARQYPTPERRMAFYRQLHDQLSGIPNLSLAIATALPFSGAAVGGLVIETRPLAQGEKPPTVSTLTIGGRYFETLGVSLRRGRIFTDRDGLPGQESAIVNERFVAMYMPDDDPIGRRIRLIDQNAPTTAVWLTIVGISPSVRQRNIGIDADPVVYLPLRGAPASNAVFIVQHATDSQASSALMRERLRAIDPDLPLYRVMTMDQVRSLATLNGRVSQALITVIACIGLWLSALGLYAVTAHAVSQRVHEIGIRMALGAQARQVMMLVLRRAMMQLVIGLLAGVACTAAWERLLGEPTQHYRMTNPLVLSLAATLVVAVAFVACLWPAHQAARLDPVIALRDE